LLFNPRYYAIWLGLLLFLILSQYKKINSSFKEHNGKTIGLFLWIIIPLLVFSIPKTKLAWYILPVFPPLAIAIGSLCGAVLKSQRNLLKLIVSAVLLICFCVYGINIFHIISNSAKNSNQDLIYHLKEYQQYKGEKIYTTNFVGRYNLPYRLNDWGREIP
jgi:4-amino-4-deoxy-L-arabinose transferase-like glycosyltransferase